MSFPPHLTLLEPHKRLLEELGDELARIQPSDALQFCFNYFSRRLEEERSRFMSGGAQAPNQAFESSIPPFAPGDEAQLQQDFDEHLIDSDEDDVDEEESEDVSPLPAVDPSRYNPARRTSVSAESMTPSRNQQDYVKLVVPKSEEQRRRIEASIGNNFLFKNLDEEQHRDVVNAMTEKRFKAGDEVIRQGAVGDFFYIVETGTLEVYIDKGAPQKVAEYGPGGSFGELALMYNAPRAATVVATSDCVLWALDRVTFRRILMENTSQKRRMYEAFLEEVPLLASLQPYERHKIADALESVYFDDGQLVIKQGDVGDNFYFVEAGEGVVIKADDKGVEHEVLQLKKGDYFGELALLNDQPRAASVRAKGRLKCATLGKKAFTRLLGPLHEILKRNSAQYVSVISSQGQNYGQDVTMS
ncbi:uncharacterized protein VTP21DRAFT_8605 [Calcarisporiella thermophila]|uniref:uncharacterized protein n=1 Tax=Calcarisporiella thermophila TaxID=911321 RepID=UPI00374345E1